MDIKILQPFTIFILLCCYKGSLGELLKVSETNHSSVFVQLLRGRDGLTGLRGERGPQGMKGSAGSPGASGTKGSFGSRGLSGVAGAPGPVGLIGSSGPAGPPGPRGAEGRIGAPGPIGLPGVSGPAGIVGPAGLRGLGGIIGEPGDVGPRGLPGFHGSIGAPGLAGPRGERGPQGTVGPPAPVSGGATYIRWGKSSCPGVTGTKQVYTGIAGGSRYNQEGGGSNYLCLPIDPEYSSTLDYRAGIQYSSPIHGTEYQNPLQGITDHNVPCAVCRVSTRTTAVMIPAKASCPPTWTREYYGYLMTQPENHKRTTFECVDRDMESLRGSHGNTNGAVFYHTEATCLTGLPCPPYNNHQELNCVVCTK